MIELIDVQVGFGGTIPGQTTAIERDDLLQFCHKYNLGSALVRMEPVELDTDVAFSNDLLFSSCSDTLELIPCPTVFPNSGGDYLSEVEQIDRAIVQGAAAVTIRPAIDYWAVAPWVSDPLLRALVDRNMPIWISPRTGSLLEIAEIARTVPETPVILAQVGYRDQRVLLPMLKSYKNIHLSIGNNYCLHQGLEQVVRDTGCAQLLFGSGFPESEPMAAVMMLINSDLSTEEKQRIGNGNFQLLREGIR